MSHIEQCPDTGPACASAHPPAPYWHHVHELLSDTALDGSIGITKFFAIDARFVVHAAVVHPLYETLAGQFYFDPNEIHHHWETLVGPGDPWVLARLGASSGKLTTTARAGVSLPLGRTEPNPYILAAEGKSHEHIQFGTGTVVPIVGAGVSLDLAPLTLSASATGLFNFYEDPKGYRAPMRVFGGARGELAFYDGRLKPYATFDVDHEGEEYWSGLVSPEGSNIKTAFLGGLGLASDVSKNLELHASFRAHLGELASGPTRNYFGVFDMGATFHADLVAGRSR